MGLCVCVCTPVHVFYRGHPAGSQNETQTLLKYTDVIHLVTVARAEPNKCVLIFKQSCRGPIGCAHTLTSIYVVFVVVGWICTVRLCE